MAPSVWRPTPSRPEELFTADELARSRRRSVPLGRLRTARTTGRAAVLVALVVLEVPRRALDALGVDGWVASVLVVLGLVEMALLVVDLPLDAWLDLRHERRLGVSTQTAGGLLRDVALSTGASLALGAALLVPAYALVRWTAWWWLWAWAGVVAYLVVGSLVAPLLAGRLRRLAPLADPVLAERVAVVARRAHVPLGRVLTADDERQDGRHRAEVVGVGSARRIVLHPSLLVVAPELVEQVVAHELGHVRRHHLLRTLPVVALAALVALAAVAAVGRWAVLVDALGLDGAGDPAGLPLAVLVVGVASAVLALPVAWVSRAFEREADREALRLLGRPDRVEAVLRRLHADDPVGLVPSTLDRWRAGHPPVAERIAYARAWGPARSGSTAHGG